MPEGDGLYIPALGRNFQMVELITFTCDFTVKEDGKPVTFKVPHDETWMVVHAGAKVTAAGHVWIDEQLMKQPHDDAAHLRVVVGNAHPRETLRLSLRHLDYFFPQLWELRVGVELRQDDVVDVCAPPGTLVVLGGVRKQPVRR